MTEVTPDELLALLTDRLAAIPGVLAVTLGGSRARGTNRPDSDWDFGLYYRGEIDPEDVRALGYPGTVAAAGDWAYPYPMNGGAWLTVEGHNVDLHYRDIADVERWTSEAQEGRWELFRVPWYLCGMPSYVLVGEAALGRILAGELSQPSFPDLLAERGPEKWRWEASFAIGEAQSHAERGDVAPCLGKLAFAVVAEAQGRLLSRHVWALSEKGVVTQAGLADVQRMLAANDELPSLVRRLQTALQQS
jgi:predicted nucleotidyltransferase